MVLDFIDLYSRGEAVKACQCDIIGNDKLSVLVGNYSLALRFDSHAVLQRANAVLLEYLEGKGGYDEFVAALLFDKYVLDCYQHGGGDDIVAQFIERCWEKKPLSEDELNGFIEGYEGLYRGTFDAFARLENNLCHFISSKRDLYRIFVEKNFFLPPKPYLPWGDDLPHCDEQAIFVFDDVNSLLGRLGNVRLDDKLVLVANIHPVAQLHLQDITRDFDGLIVSTNEDTARLLEECIATLPDDWWEDNDAAQALYRHGKKYACMERLKLLGPQRSAMQYVVDFVMGAYENYRAIPDYVLAMDDSIPYYPGVKRAQKRPWKSSPPYSIAHVVPVIHDTVNHAPTTLLKKFLAEHDREWSGLYVISSEQFVRRSEEYPIVEGGKSSWEWGSSTIAKMMSQGTMVYVEDEGENYLAAAQNIANFMQEEKIEIAIFHEPLPIHEFAASISDVPCCLFLDHSTGMPHFSCFDGFIIGNPEEIPRLKEQYDVPMMGCRKVINKVHRKELKRKDFSLPEDGVLLVSVFNHPHSRLSLEMCKTIVHILRRCPQAYYVVIGDSKQTGCRKFIFQHYGVDDRVIWLGGCNSVIDALKVMDIFLNEFPWGGGLSVIEAMAVGLPVVSMYIDEGPVAGRQGAYIFGRDRAVEDVFDYEELACRLIEDLSFRNEWSQIAQARYNEYYSHLRSYQKDLEELYYGIRESCCVH